MTRGSYLREGRQIPTYEWTQAFERDLSRLTTDQKKRFLSKLYAFIADVGAMEEGEIDGFRGGLRVKGVRGAPGLFEMAWAPDGRATFMWGDPVYEGKRHVIWVRCGNHSILP